MSSTNNQPQSKDEKILDDTNLNDLYNEAFKEYKYLDRTSEPTNADPYQIQLKKTINKLEKITQLVSALDMFSGNEDYKELPSDSLKYLMLPFLLGSLTLRLQLVNRVQILEIAEVYFKDFLHRCLTYGISDYRIPKAIEVEIQHDDSQHHHSHDMKSLMEKAHVRNIKIQRFKELQELQHKMDDLENQMKNCQDVDEDVKREYYLSQLRAACNQTIDELDGISAEKSILRQRACSKPHEDKPPRVHPPNFHPFMITRTAVEKKVLGAGYPSLPVMSVEEFYDERVKQGLFPDRACTSSQPKKQVASADEQHSESEDEDKQLQKDRAWSEWHDEHRIGYGNTQNKG